MKTKFKTVQQILIAEKQDEKTDCPLNLSVLPNQMGINLCSVEGVSWTRQKDGQLVSLTIHFLPNN